MIEACTRTRGYTTCLEGDPRFDTYEDVLYVPLDCPAGTPGIYDRGRRLVTGAASFFGNPAVHPGLGASFVSSIDPDEIAGVVDEPLIFGGHIDPHYGHFLTSTLSRFWWVPKYDRSKRRVLVLNGAISAYFAHPHVASFFGALDLATEDFVAFPQPVRIRLLIVPNASFEESNLVYEAFPQLGAWIGDRIAPNNRDDRLPPIYLSKSRLTDGINRFVNEKDFTDALQKHGFEIVHPEALSPKEQITLFRTRRVICGTNGSALHTTIFAPANDIYVLNYLDPPPDTDQHLIDRVKKNRSVQLFAPDFLNIGRDDHFHNNFILPGADEAAERFASLVLNGDDATVMSR